MSSDADEVRSADDAAVIAAVSARIDQPHQEQRWRALLAVFAVFVMLAFAGALIALIYVASQGAQQRDRLIAQTEQNQQTAERVEHLTRRIDACATPNSRCYEVAEAQRAAQTGVINATVLAVGVCLNTPGPTLPPDVFRECVLRVVDLGE